MRLPSPPLLLITDRHQARGDLPAITAAAFSAGCRWLSLREKDLPPDEQRALIRKLLQLAQPHRGIVTVHGDPDLAGDAGAHGVHLPSGSDAAAARRLLGPDALIGVSVHGPDGARAVDPEFADYVIAGPLFETASKPGYGPALGPIGLGSIVEACAVPVIAIGGIAPDNVADCCAAGASGVAVMGGVMRAESPGRMVTQLLEALRTSRTKFGA